MNVDEQAASQSHYEIFIVRAVESELNRTEINHLVITTNEYCAATSDILVENKHVQYVMEGFPEMFHINIFLPNALENPSFNPNVFALNVRQQTNNPQNVELCLKQLDQNNKKFQQ